MSTLRASAERALAESATREPQWLADVASDSAQAFVQHGVPSRALERWRYTDLKALAGRDYAFSGVAGSVEIDEIDALLERDCTALLVLIDGELDALHTRRLDLARGLHVLTLQEALREFPDRLKPLLEARFDAPEDALMALNGALLRGGFVIALDAELNECPTIEILHLSSQREQPLAINTRGLVLAEAGTRAKIVEHFGHIGGGNLLNAVTQLKLAEGAQIHYVRCQDLCARGQLVGALHAQIQRDAALDLSVLDFGGSLARLDTRIALVGERARFDVRGLTAIGERAHIDHQLEIRHVARNAASTQAFRTVANGRARAVFAGKVIVEPGADGADAQQSTRNLLLSPHAEIDTKPELEIYADEVKCSHGATVGQLDDSALYYLRSRGIGIEQARGMLLGAFVDAVLDLTPAGAIQTALKARFGERFRG
jgi:Fe-S cluster assembly protein SufD